MKLNWISILCLAAIFSSCASMNSKRAPAAVNGHIKLSRKGDQCQLNLDQTKQPGTVVINEVSGHRVVTILQPLANGQTKFFVEELSSAQYVECITNTEPGAPFQGTDDSEKAIRVNLMTDYIRIGKPQADARFMYFDASSGSYKSIYRGD